MKNFNTKCSIKYESESKFANWVFINMDLLHISRKDICDKLHVSKQTFFNNVNGRYKPSYCYVLGLCYIFNCLFDVDNVYKLVEEDWKD